MCNLHTHTAVIGNVRLIFQAITSTLLSSERLENAPVQIGLEPDEQLPAQRWMWQPISIACTLNILAPKRHIASCARSERFAIQSDWFRQRFPDFGRAFECHRKPKSCCTDHVFAVL